MRQGEGTGLEVRIQAGFENDLLASWRKIPEKKSLTLSAGKMLPLEHIWSPLRLSAHWTLCTATVLSQYNPSHQCVVVLLLQKHQEKLQSVTKCKFLVLQNAEPSSTTLIFGYTHFPKQSFFAGTDAAALLLQHFYYRWGIFHPLLRNQGWMVSILSLKMGVSIPEEME